MSEGDRIALIGGTLIVALVICTHYHILLRKLRNVRTDKR